MIDGRVTWNEGNLFFIEHTDQVLRVDHYPIKVVNLMRGFGVDKWFKIPDGRVRLVTKFYPEGGDAYNSVCSLKANPQLGKRDKPSSEHDAKHPAE